MLFFPPTAELASSTAAALDPMAMESSFLLGGALMPPPSAIQQQQQQQQVQNLQLQQQIFAMEQHLQQQTFLPADGGPPPPPSTFFPLFDPTTTTMATSGILPPSLQQMSERVAVDEALKAVENTHLQSQIYQSQGNLLMQSILPSSIPTSLLPPPISAGDQLNPPPSPPHMAMPPTGPCGFCRLPILEKNFLFIDAQSWHLNCVHCADCGQNLEQLGATCFAKDGFLYCRRDYLAKFGKLCQRCGIPIQRGELVMRVPQQQTMPSATSMPPSTSADSSIFHVHCFTCIFCGQMLTPGEQYTAGSMKQPAGSLFCRAHFHMNPSSQTPFGPSPAPQFQSALNSLGGNSEEESRFLLVELKDAEGGKNELTDKNQPPSGQFIGQQIEANKENPSATDLNDQQLVTTQQNGGSPTSIEDFGCCPRNSNDAHSSNGGGSSSQKQKRMRTSFKHHQLRTMKHYFNLNHNPDAKDLKQLAMKTGLTKRVLQVWFQNARAKYRRNQQHKIDGTSICGGSIVDGQAASISHHPQQILMPMSPNGGYHSQQEQQQPLNSMPSIIGQIETEMGQQFPVSLPAQHPPPPILCSNPKANSLSPMDDGGSSSTMGASSISLNASADEQSSENSFQ